MSDPTPATGRLKTEIIVFVILLAIGLVLVPLAVFWTGTAVFGAYAEGGLGDFLSRLASDLTSGSRALWFLVFAPYLVWQCLRLVALAWRLSGKMA